MALHKSESQMLSQRLDLAPFVTIKAESIKVPKQQRERVNEIIKKCYLLALMQNIEENNELLNTGSGPKIGFITCRRLNISNRSLIFDSLPVFLVSLPNLVLDFRLQVEKRGREMGKGLKIFLFWSLQA